MLTAFYDLQVSPPTWDFTKFLMVAALRRRTADEPIRVVIVPGPKHGFRDDTLPPDVAMRRQMLRNVVIRYCDLVPHVETRLCQTRGEAQQFYERAIAAKDLILPDGYTVESPLATYNEHHLIDAYQAAGSQMPAVVVPDSVAMHAHLLARDEPPVLILLRECPYWPERNSNLAVWTLFAHWLQEIGQRVLIVRDAHQVGQDLAGLTCCHEATSDIAVLYALMTKARMVYGVTQGTMALVWWSAVPYHCYRWFYPANGRLAYGGQFPWSTASQRLHWGPETMEVLRETVRVNPRKEEVCVHAH